MKKIILPDADCFNYPFRGYEGASNNHYKDLRRSKEQWIKLRVKLLLRQNYKCAYCLCSLRHRRMNVEHVLPLKRGGQNYGSNLVASCTKCNKDKLNKILTKKEKAGLEANLSRLRREVRQELRSIKKEILDEDQRLQDILKSF